MGDDKKTDLPDEKYASATASVIERTLESFDIQVKIVEVELVDDVYDFRAEIAMGTKGEDILARSQDIALATASETGKVEITIPIPGRALISIKVPRRTEFKSKSENIVYKVIKVKELVVTPSILDQIRGRVFIILWFVGLLVNRLAYWIKPPIRRRR